MHLENVTVSTRVLSAADERADGRVGAGDAAFVTIPRVSRPEVGLSRDLVGFLVQCIASERAERKARNPQTTSELWPGGTSMSDRDNMDVGPKLLSGGNPQIPKGDGDRPAQDYIAAMPGWKHDVGKRLDDIITRVVPQVHKGVKWNQPFYGVQGEGWFLSFRCYTKYVQVQFLKGTSLDPMPPKASKHPEVRYLDIHESDELDKGQLRSWIEQASNLPGEKM